MDAPKQARVLNRNRSADPPQPQRGEKQIVIPMTREQFDQCWHDPSKMRKIVDRIMAESPELFPACLLNGYAFMASLGHRKSSTACSCEKSRTAAIPKRFT